MSEAPKKIWYDPYSFEGGLEKLSQHDTQYIRADLVDGLVEACETMLFELVVGPTCKEAVIANARAALKLLEEE